jgi:hypothetical protein
MLSSPQAQRMEMDGKYSSPVLGLIGVGWPLSELRVDRCVQGPARQRSRCGPAQADVTRRVGWAVCTWAHGIGEPGFSLSFLYLPLSQYTEMLHELYRNFTENNPILHEQQRIHNNNKT